MKTVFAVGAALGFLLEILVLACLYDTSTKISAGGDVFHNQVENLPMKVGDETRTLSAGTYVVTNQGPVRLPWYWIYQYSYATVSLPILVAVGSLWMYSRSAKRK